MSDIVYLEHTDVGATLTTWIYCSFWQMFSAERLGLRSYINWPRDRKRALYHYYDDKKFDETPNMFHWYFEQPMADADEASREASLIWEWTAPPPELAKAQGEHQLYTTPSHIRAFYQKHLKLNAEVNARGAALAQKYNIDFSKTIGVTWRGTDSRMDGRPRMPIETYFPFLDNILANEPDLRIMCTAEESGILAPLLLRYPQAFMVHEFETAPTTNNPRIGDNPERFSLKSGFERGMQPALMVYLFSKCAYLIKNRASTSAVASWLSNGKTICLAHPENLGHGWDINLAEIDGKAVPLNR